LGKGGEGTEIQKTSEITTKTPISNQKLKVEKVKKSKLRVKTKPWVAQESRIRQAPEKKKRKSSGKPKEKKLRHSLKNSKKQMNISNS